MKYQILFPLLISIVLSGCAAGNDQAGADPGEPSLEEPRSFLYAHDVTGARDQFALRVDQGTATSTDHAGLAIAEALALPLSDEFNTILLDHLGATRPLTNEVLYGIDGLLYLVSLGVPWADGGDLKGIETLLGERLPWQRQRLASPDAFVDGLSRPVDFLADALVALAEGPVQRMRDSAQQAVTGEPFEFVIPGAVFHDDALELTVGPSDLAVVDAAGAAVQGVIYFFGAYANEWTIERAFGTAAWEPIVADATHELHIEGATASDYQLAHLNEHLLRKIEATDRLTRSRDALSDTFGALATAVELGVDAQARTTLEWNTVPGDLAADVAQLLRAIEDAFDGPTVLPFFAPELTADFSPLFEGGRTIPAETDLIVTETYSDEFGEYTETAPNEDALNAFIEGVFTPPLDGEVSPEFTLGEDLGMLVDDVTTPYATEVDRAYSRSF